MTPGRRLALLLIVVLPTLLRAQSSPAATGRPELQATDSGRASLPATITASGRVVRGTTAGDRPLAGQMVVLHHIAAAGSGPVDSARTDRAGRFRFTWTPVEDGVYLLSARYGGIAYFSPPVGGNSAPTDLEIAVFDTSSAAVPIALRGRHIIISAPDEAGMRAVVEVFELSNDSTVTRIGDAVDNPTWETQLPAGAVAPRVGQGDIAAAAVLFDHDDVRLSAPMPPGIKQLALSYELPPAAFPFTLRARHPATVLELLLEESGGSATGAGLKVQPAVTVDGRSFQRYLAQDVASGASATVVLPVPAPPSRSAPDGIALALTTGLGALGVAWGIARRRPRSPSLSTTGRCAPPAPNEALETARAIAALDAAFAEAGLPPADRADYERERGDLKARLVATLASFPD